MNNITKKYVALFLAATSMATAAAQESSTGYFLENYNMRWQMNPAMGNRTDMSVSRDWATLMSE